MRIVISPAKSLDFQSELPNGEHTYPQLLEKSQVLINQLRALNPTDISSLMSVSSKLAELNFIRFQQWQQPFNTQNARPAVYAFDGDVYDGMDVRTLNKEQVSYLQQHLRILSGLYGMLKPLDLIQPYRLEMGIKLPVDDAKNLYGFWGATMTDILNQEMKSEPEPILVNLASEEYFKSIIPLKLNARIITPVFMEAKGDKPRIIAFMAKRARGMMVRFMAEQAIADIHDIKTFDYGGYCFMPSMSTDSRWVFVR